MSRHARSAGDLTGQAEPEAQHRHDTRIALYFLGAALVVRLIGIGSASIWFDEAISRYRASLPWADYFAHMSGYAGTNLWELLLRPFAYGSVLLLRIPPLIASMIALWLAWRIADALRFTGVQKITAAIPLVFLPGLIWQAQDARYYAAITLMYMAGVWFALGRRPLGLLACMGLLPYLHPTGPSYAFGLLTAAWICGLGFLKGLGIGGLAFLSWLPRLYQIQSSQAFVGLQRAGNMQPGHTEFWLREVTPYYVIDQSTQALTVNTLSLAGRLILFAFMLLACAVAATRFREYSARLLLIATITPIMTLLAMTILQPVFFYRPVQPATVPFCLLVGLVLAPRKIALSKIPPAVGLVLLIIGIINWNPAARGGYLEEGAQTMARHWQAGDRIAYASITVATPFRFYLPDLEACLIPHNGMGELPKALQTMIDCTDYESPGTWIVWPLDPTLDEDLAHGLQDAVEGRLPVWRSDIAWQFAPIEIYYLP